MMREFKFRAWDKGLSNDDNIPMMTQALTIQEWIDQKEFYYVNGYQANLSDFDWKNELIFMQYTGLKDKNGVEIYEGDVLQYPDDYKSKGTVIFRDGGWHANGRACYINYESFSRCEVIGNIYEHEFLLKNN